MLISLKDMQIFCQRIEFSLYGSLREGWIFYLISRMLEKE